jgi:hypothetical protein
VQNLEIAAMADELRTIGSVLLSDADPRFSDFLMKQRVVEIAELLRRASDPK